MTATPNEWPLVPFDSWADTARTVHLYTQMLGKTKLALSPAQPEWLHASLDVGARGLTTGSMPWGTSAVEASLDFVDNVLRVATSDGYRAEIDLSAARSVAEVWQRLLGIYEEIGIDADVWDKPQELADTTPFSTDTRSAVYDTDAVRRWWTVITAVRGVFDRWRSPFFGRSHVVFWWGAFDIGVMRFSGRTAAAPNDKGYIMRYDLDAEFMNAGFWPGDENVTDPMFYAYIQPKPEGCELAPIDAHGAAWIEQMGEWTLPYDRARACDDPARAVCDFLDQVYMVAGEYGGWDLDAYRYTPPAPSERA